MSRAKLPSNRAFWETVARTGAGNRQATHFHFRWICWIMKEVVRGLTAPLSARKFRIGSRGQKPCVAACQVGGFFNNPLQLLASRGGWPIRCRCRGEPTNNARDHHPPVSDLQEQELLHHEEQEDDHRSARVLKVLQYLPQAHGPQRDEVRSSPWLVAFS